MKILALIIALLVVVAESSLKLKTCKHGDFLLSTADTHVSRHLNTYGEWAEIELQLFLQIIKPGDIVLDIGANIGAFTVPLANKVGNFGRVYAIEPQRNANIAFDELSNVITLWSAVGNESGTVDVPLIDYTHEGNYAAISLADPALRSTIPWRQNRYR